MPECSGFSSRCQSSERSWLHSASCANSWPMNSSFLPGCAHMNAYSARRFARFCQRVARHLVDQRALAVHDLVVRQRQDEVLRERVDERERQLVVVVAAVDRVLLEVRQRVVHPAHVPLEAEAEAAQVGGPRDARPRGRLLGRRDHAGLAREQHLVELLEERDRVEVLAAAELVRHPLARLARVVEVEHRGDGVDADAVDVVLAHPEQGVGDEEVADLVAPVVEDQRAPVRVRAAARVGVLVERGAVEARERELVAREVRRHPVEDHAEAVAVQAVDELAEVVGRAEARRRRVVAGHLVAPRAA